MQLLLERLTEQLQIISGTLNGKADEFYRGLVCSLRP